jgi:DNA polymerase-4
MAALGIVNGADLREKDLVFLRQHFGAQADYLYRAARGIDLRRVRPNRPRKSIGTERTFERDISTGSRLREVLAHIVDLVWDDIEKVGAKGRTVTLKLRLSDFTLRTHARSLNRAVEGREELARLAGELLDNVLPLPQPVRLMGVTLSALEGRQSVSAPVIADEGGGSWICFEGF